LAGERGSPLLACRSPLRNGDPTWSSSSIPRTSKRSRPAWSGAWSTASPRTRPSSPSRASPTCRPSRRSRTWCRDRCPARCWRPISRASWSRGTGWPAWPRTSSSRCR